MPTIQPDGDYISLPTGTISDLAISPDGDTVYVARAGVVSSYDAASGALVTSWEVGGELGGLDVSANGRYLVVTDRTAGRSTASNGSTSLEFYVHYIDTQTGTTTTFKHTDSYQYNAHFHDASFLPDGRIIMTQSFFGSGWLPLTILDPVTGAFTAGEESFAQDGTLTATPDKSMIAFMPSNISDAPVFVYTFGEGVTASHQGYEDDVYGFNSGVQAIAPDGSLIAQGLGLNIYDGDLNMVIKLGEQYPLLSGDVIGLAFSVDGSELYVLTKTSRQIFVFDTDSWTVVRGYAAGGELDATQGGYGNSLLLSKDGDALIVAGSVDVRVINLDVALPDAVSEGDDTITGDSSDGQYFGFGGNDTIDGGAGSDIMIGGKGNDTYYVDSPADQVIELAGEGRDIVIARIDGYRLPNEVEILRLGAEVTIGIGNSSANTISGNALANTLFGGHGDDRLYGEDGDDMLLGDGGNDTMEGGKGNDIYYVESPADLIVENLGEGTDTVITSVSYTLSANVENLTLEDGNETISGTGNALSNVLAGNQGDNNLDGKAGDDTLIAGSGNDRLTGGMGNDVLDGGLGQDTAIFSGRSSDYFVQHIDGKLLLIDLVAGRDGSDVISGVETFRFSDGSLSEAAVSDAAVGATAWRLYSSAGFSGEIGGSGDVFGTTGFDDVTVLEGAGVITFDSSFNRGDDIVCLFGDAADWRGLQTGSAVTLINGDTLVYIPVGVAGMAMEFDDGVRELRYDTSLNAIQLGGQSIGAAFAPLLAAPDGSAVPDGADAAAIARLTLINDASVTAGGNLAVFGTISNETVTLTQGRATFDPSFNRGGDTIMLGAAVERFTTVRNGSVVSIEGLDLEISVPVGNGTTTLVFAGGDERSLSLNSAMTAILIGDQVIGLDPVALAAA